MHILHALLRRFVVNVTRPATVFPAMFEDFVRLVVPELQRRGLFRHEYQGRTLRENLLAP